MRVSTCAVSGGFIHLYTALDNGLFDKYGIKLENIFIRGSAQNLTALATDEVQFTYCASDAIIPGMAAGIEVKIVASPLVKLPYVLVTRKEVQTAGGSQGQSFGNRARRRLERPAVARGREKTRPVPRRGDDPAHRRQPRRTLSGDGGRHRPRRDHHAAARCPRQERGLQCDVSPDRSEYTVHLQLAAHQL